MFLSSLVAAEPEERFEIAFSPIPFACQVQISAQSR
jgi:hypothetical protein